MERISKENYYLDIAQTVLERATCLQRRTQGPAQLRRHGLLHKGSPASAPGRAV